MAGVCRNLGPAVLEDFKPPQPDDGLTQCLICQDTFNLSISPEIFFLHLFEVHNFVIEDTQNIYNLKEYVDYWRNRFKTDLYERIVPSLNIETASKKYYLLSTLTPEDKALRHRLKLEKALKTQQFEREDKSYIRQCLFCRLNFEGLRYDFLEHLSTKHNLQLGLPSNLVYIDELIEKIDKKLNELVCIFCEKNFPERSILKEHMRKKLHKRIHPKNAGYDKYFILNYLEEGKTWREHKQEHYDNIGPENEDEEYADWKENENDLFCLFCRDTFKDINLLFGHLKDKHEFDFVKETKDLSFYQKIKLVNYIRQETFKEKRCFYCQEKFEGMTELGLHLEDKNHCLLPSLELFDQPEYYFPIFEDDALLYQIEDDDVEGAV